MLVRGMSDEEVLAQIERVVNIVAPSFKFGIYDVDDIKQEARLFALNALSKYETGRSLGAFLYCHIYNRLVNLKRDKFTRTDAPCLACHNSVDGHTDHPNHKYCNAYRSWLKTNTSKQNLMVPLDISNIDDESEANMRMNAAVEDFVITKELLELIDENLPVELRGAYLQMRAGQRLPMAIRQEVERAVLFIIGESHGAV